MFMNSNITTPADLARELDISAKAVRTFLRSVYGVLPPFMSRWLLDAKQAAYVRDHFRGA